jgi:hypothetical protein
MILLPVVCCFFIYDSSFTDGMLCLIGYNTKEYNICDSIAVNVVIMEKLAHDAFVCANSYDSSR